nr:MAG: wsv327-like protein [Penaeus semisulcatus pemonivirus]
MLFYVGIIFFSATVESLNVEVRLNQTNMSTDLKILHNAAIPFVLSLPSEDVLEDNGSSVENIGKGISRYISEGLFSAIEAMRDEAADQQQGTTTSAWVLATDILGPTWFSKVGDGHLPSGIAPQLLTHIALTPARCRSSALFTARMWKDLPNAVDQMSSQILSPRWRLSSFGLEALCDPTAYHLAPILNTLNAFEMMMTSIFFAAAEVSNQPAAGLTPAIAMDQYLDANNPASTLGIGLALARAERIVCLFCGTLASIVAWKRRVHQRSGGRILPSITHSPEEGLEENILDRAASFVNPRGSEEVIEGYSSPFLQATLMNNRGYAVPSIKLTLVTVLLSKRFLPAFEGSFYETILGTRVLSHLAPLMSAEYGYLLARADALAVKRMVDDSQTLPPICQIEKQRRNRLSEIERRAEAAIPKGVSIIDPYRDSDPSGRKKSVDTRGVDDFHREVRRVMDSRPNLSVEEAVKTIFGSPQTHGRQLVFSNFAGTGLPSVSLYCLWNFMALATGGRVTIRPDKTIPYPVVGRLCRRLLAQCLLIDFHAILRCSKCSAGIVAKTNDAFGFVDTLRHGQDAEIRAKTNRAFGHKARTVIDGFRSMLQLRWADPPYTAENGRVQLAAVDYKTELLLKDNPTLYTDLQLTSSQQSKGYALFAVYALLASALVLEEGHGTVSARHKHSTKWADTVMTVLGRSPSINNEHRPSEQEKELRKTYPTPIDDKDNDLLCFAAVWALRNAVRMRRNVQNKINPGFPGAPLPLINALDGNEDSLQRILDHPALRPEFERHNHRISIVFSAFEHLITAREGDTAHGWTVSAALRKLGQSREGHNSDVKGYANHTHPFADRGELYWSADRLQQLSKDDLSILNAFPLTEYDLD